jgi:predicted nucleic acid-binding protein
MRFWDTSALIPLIMEEDSSGRLLSLFKTDPHVLTSTFTSLEVSSAVWRRRHANEITVAAHQAADELFADLSATWTEVPVSDGEIESAISVMSRHPLRAGDALLLGTAVLAAGPTMQLVFVTLDEKQRAAARAEGLTVLP